MTQSTRVDLGLREKSQPGEAQPEQGRLAPVAHRITYRNRRYLWTPTELETLVAVYEDPDAYAYEAAARLGRTRYAIECKASELGLKKRLREWQE